MKTILEFLPNHKHKGNDEYAGPCPWCQGTDRFIAWPNQGKGGRYMCRQCQAKGDFIDFLKVVGLSYREALNEIGLESDSAQRKPRFVGELGTVGVEDSSLCKKDKFASKEWIVAATSFVQSSFDNLKENAMDEWEKTLSSKHLTLQTAQEFRLGWNPRDQYIPCQAWGLEGNKLRIPRGLVIPIWLGSEVVAIKIRCADPGAGPRYWQVKGSGSDSLCLGERGRPTLLVESDLDAYLIWQEAGADVSVIALGGSERPLSKGALEFLNASQRILISTDFDDQTGGKIGAGQQSFYRLKQQFPHAEYFPTAIGKDPCDMQTLGVPIKLWIGCVVENDKGESQEFRLPEGYRGTLSSFISGIRQHPLLVPCPKTSPAWSWVYRENCQGCTGHIHCVKDFRPPSSL